MFTITQAQIQDIKKDFRSVLKPILRVSGLFSVLVGTHRCWSVCVCKCVYLSPNFMQYFQLVKSLCGGSTFSLRKKRIDGR